MWLELRNWRKCQGSNAARGYHQMQMEISIRREFCKTCCIGWRQYQWLDAILAGTIRERLKVENTATPPRGVRLLDWGGLGIWKDERNTMCEEEEEMDRQSQRRPESYLPHRQWSRWHNWLDDNYLTRRPHVKVEAAGRRWTRRKDMETDQCNVK